MGGTFIVISIIAGAVAGGLVGLLTRRRGKTASGIAMAVAAVAAFGAVTLARPAIERMLNTDEQTWTTLVAEMEKTGFDLRLMFSTDPRLEEEFKREVMVIVRQHRNDPERVARAAERMGLDLYRKYIGPKAPYGSAESIVEWGRAQLGLLEAVAAISRDNCGDVALGRTAVLGALGKRIAPATNRVIAAAVAAYKSSNPANAPPSAQEMEPVWKAIFLGPDTPFTEADVNAFAAIETIPRAEACGLTITFMKRILALPEAQTIGTLRAIMAEAAKG